MSNIYDALKKGKGLPGKDPTQIAPPVPPDRLASSPLPVLDDPERNSELDALRRRILLEVPPDRPSCLVMTAAVPGEGATTISLLVAQELAAHGRGSVLLVDGDLAGGAESLTGSLETGGQPGSGFADLLAGQSELSSWVLGTEQAGLHFLPRGRITLSAPELVRLDRVKRAMHLLAQSYSFVILDTGAVLRAPETPLLAAGADGVILVVRANRTRREVVQRTTQMLGKVNCRLLGTVLNDRRYPVPGFLYHRL